MTDTYTFGPVYRLRNTGYFTRETWKDRWADALADVFWPKPTFTVTRIDQDAGLIEIK